MAIVTTIMTTPLVLWWMRGTELEPQIAASGFGRGHVEPAQASNPTPLTAALSTTTSNADGRGSRNEPHES